MWDFQFSFSSNVTPRNCIWLTHSMSTPSIGIFICSFVLQIPNNIHFVLLKFNVNLLISNHHFMMVRYYSLEWNENVFHPVFKNLNIRARYPIKTTNDQIFTFFFADFYWYAFQNITHYYCNTVHHLEV